ncbi:MAG: sugar hydrolase [bacterium]|nr:MAG: sugar hydrolase [bacterium]
MTTVNHDYPKNNIGREIIPMKIINQTKRENLYFYVVGTTDPKNPANHCYFLSDFNGNVTLCTLVKGETSYSLCLTEAETTIQLPRLSGMRIYFSFDKKLNVLVQENGIPSAPAGWVQGSNFQTLFDWAEFTWEVNATDMTLGGNVTQVDMFGLPFAFSLTGFDPNGQPVTLVGGFSSGGLRHKIFNALKQAPAPWNNLVVSNAATGEDYRAISPYHGMEFDQLFPYDQLDNYINQVWEKYTTETLTATAENAIFTGQVSEGNLVFTSSTDRTITFPKPNSFMVYTSGPMPTVDSKKAGVIQAALQAAFMRSTLLLSSSLPDCNVADFYQGEPVNLYAKTLHEFSMDGKAYGFGFDDVCSESSTVIVHNPLSAQITLLEF